MRLATLGLRERAATLGLTIDAPTNWSATAPLDVAALQSEMWSEGYFVVPPCLPAELVARCRAAIELVLAAGAPALASFAFDAPWELQRLLAAPAAAALDDTARLRPAFWAWRLTADEPRGWSPHRDRPGMAIDDRGTPTSISVWVPLTDATADNGCMYVVPAPLDVQYANPRASLEVLNLQCVRALPAPAGSVLGWTARLLHWGGIARAGTAGRISLSFEYQAPHDPTPAFASDWIPSPAERVALIEQQWDQYDHMHEQPPERRERLAAVLAALR